MVETIKIETTTIPITTTKTKTTTTTILAHLLILPLLSLPLTILLLRRLLLHLLPVAIRNLLAEKNRLHKAYVDHPTDATKAAFYRSRRQLQQRLREMQDVWTARKAEEIQGYADRNEWKNFFSAIKAVYGPATKGTAPLLSADGSTLLTEKTQILQRWAEHF
nr:unnamed protein product [Spirometra erinaceieuropaei]